MSLEQALARLRAPDERAAQVRAWQVVGSAYRERPPLVRRRSRRPLAFVPVLIALVAALTLTPAGATVSRLISHALGVPHAARTLLSLPAPGTLLVSGAGGTWTVSAGGSRRRLGSWREASWSPHGRYIVAAMGDTLAAIDPRGSTHWTLARRAVSDPSWYVPTGFRVAYRSGSNLRVVAGDGTGDHLLATGVAPVAPAWRPDHPYQLAYVQRHRVVLRDADSGRVIWTRPTVAARKLGWSADGSRLLSLGGGGARVLTAAGRTIAVISLAPRVPVLDGSLSPDGRQLALVRGGVGQGVLLAALSGPRAAVRTVLSGPGMRQVAWSPNGRWLLVSWPAADQWVFAQVTGAPRIAAVSRIAQQFTPGSRGLGLPRVDGWCCTTHGRVG